MESASDIKRLCRVIWANIRTPSSLPADVAALERLLLALGALGASAKAAPRIAEIDLNPVIVHPNGEEISLIDARVRLSD
ncbi:MAG: acetate--CoA ligase family protein [Blastocatellales bacterium]